MGLGNLFHRDLEYVATNTETGASQTYTIVNDLIPDWQNTGPYSGAMAIPGAWRASLLLSDLIGGMPWHALRERTGKPAERLVPNPPLLERPAPPDVRVTTFSSLALDYLWHGNAISLVAARNAEGWPVATLPISATAVETKRVSVYDHAPLPVGSVGYRVNGSRWYAAHDVIHIKAPCEPGALRGMGVLENHLVNTLGLASEQNRHARSLSGSAIPTGVIRSSDPDLQPDEASEIKTAWKRSQRDRTVAVLNHTLEFLPVSWNPTETQLLEARKFSLHEIALIFGLPLSFLGADQATRTYSNIEQEDLNLLKYSLNGILARFEQTLSSHMPRGTWAKANLDAFLRADTLSRYQAHALAVQNGFLTVDEVRALEDKPPLTAAQRALAAPPAAPPGPAAPHPAVTPERSA